MFLFDIQYYNSDVKVDFCSAGSVSNGDSTWMSDLVNATEMFDNSESKTNKNSKDPLWMILMDQSQLVMTVIGLIGNIATSITLIKNGQVGGALTINRTRMQSSRMFTGRLLTVSQEADRPLGRVPSKGRSSLQRQPPSLQWQTLSLQRQTSFLQRQNPLPVDKHVQNHYLTQISFAFISNKMVSIVPM